jgi:dimethylhistidine N-methyltransferase
MQAARTAPTPLFTSDFGRDMHRALANQPRAIPPKYFYDAAGSALFDRICDLPEYYPTRTELALLNDHAPAMADHIGPGSDLIEFGAGSLTKIRLLLATLQTPSRFIPIDISGDHLASAADRLRAEHPALPIHPIAADYTKSMVLPPATGRRVGFFPGSTLGNLSSADALHFLTRAAAMLRGGGLLLGVDLVKDPAILHAAYNDAAGVTAAFNLNLLRRANAELATDFDLDGFTHHAFYNAPHQRIEMHLVSRRHQHVTLGRDRFAFQEGETIHTETSQKFTIDSLRALATQAGFRPGPVWTDPARLFSIHWLEA